MYEQGLSTDFFSFFSPIQVTAKCWACNQKDTQCLEQQYWHSLAFLYTTVQSCKCTKHLAFCYLMYQDREAFLFYSFTPMNRCGFNHIQNKMLPSFRLWLWNLGVEVFFKESDFYLIILKLFIKADVQGIG